MTTNGIVIQWVIIVGTASTAVALIVLAWLIRYWIRNTRREVKDERKQALSSIAGNASILHPVTSMLAMYLEASQEANRQFQDRFMHASPDQRIAFFSALSSTDRDNEPINRWLAEQYYDLIHRSGVLLSASSNLLARYGMIRALYSGQGTLALQSGEQLSCSFDCAQMRDATIVVRCVLKDAPPFSFDSFLPEALSGSTSDGQEIVVQGNLFVVRQSMLMHLGTPSYDIYFKANEILVKSPQQPSPIHIRLALTNLQTLGTQFVQIAPGKGMRQTPLVIGHRELIIRPIAPYLDRANMDDNYRGRIEQLKARKGVDVTCELLGHLESKDELEELLRDATDLCRLLSLSRGTMVTWIGYRLESPEGKLFERYHRQTPTKPFSNLALIDPNTPEDTLGFVHATYDRFLECQNAYGLNKAIAAYVDIKSTDVYLEMKALGVIGALSHLATRHQLAMGDSQDDMDVHTIAHIIGLSDADRSKYRRLRQDLLQTFDIVTGCHGFVESKWEGYTFLQSLLDRTLLRILGYDGYYLDISDSFERKRMESI